MIVGGESGIGARPMQPAWIEAILHQCEAAQVPFFFKQFYATPQGGRTMYYLIHATDHPEPPLLMARAYINTTLPKEAPEQLQLEPGLIGKRKS